MSASDNTAATNPPPAKGRKAFIPLECNPEVMTALVQKLGVSTNLAFHDVYSIDEPELLSFVPRPAYALLLVFPVTEKYEKDKRAEEANRSPYTGRGDGEDVIWFKQTIKNACGMFGVLHGVCNGAARSFIRPGSDLDNLLQEAIPLLPDARAELIESSSALESAHQSAANEGSSSVPDAEVDVDLHYICFVKSTTNNHLYELDGSRKGPYDRGDLGPDDDVLSERALNVIRAFIDREEGGNLNFSLVALAPSLD
ncbi:hypothetical protein BDZ91DRAFT_731749 [Kalaharituber pfeilii]|nr:hypothetical protein BDZ91DRAFT_731749 [Kalaharituber pfeilii]